MENDSYHEAMTAGGFERIGSLDWGAQAAVWWHRQHRLEVDTVNLDGVCLLRGVKHYRLKAMGEEGEIYARDLAAFDAYLTTLFNEVHVWLAHYPDITPSLARQRIREKSSRRLEGGEEANAGELDERLGQARGEFEAVQEDLRRDEGLLRLGQGRSPLLQRHLQGQISRSRSRLEQIRTQARTIHDQLLGQRRLEKEYLQKGSATCLLFACCSNIQAVRGKEEFVDALGSVVKELLDLHRFQIQQKLQGGKLQIHVEEVDAPGVSLLTRWTGAALCPRQLARLGPEFDQLRQAIEQQFMVLPREDILLGGAIQDEKKLVAARVVRSFLERLDRVPRASIATARIPQGGMPVWLGNLSGPANDGKPPWQFPLSNAQHSIITGRTGSGKSFAARVVVEGCAVYDELAILVLDPRNQWVGLCCAEDRPEILAKYKDFGLAPAQARGFGFTFHGLGLHLGEPLPEDLRKMARGRRIVSFKGMDDRSRCDTFADILEAVFEACADSESQHPRVLVVIEEVTRFIRKGVGGEAEEAAERVEQCIDKVAREGRKYGLTLWLASQSYRDLSHSLATVRQNITTRIFMSNSDREVDFADEHLGDGRQIVSLRTGEALVCNPEWGVVRVVVRPPLSKVFEPPDEEVRRLLGVPAPEPHRLLSNTAKSVLKIAQELRGQTGRPVKLSSIVEKLAITSRRRIDQIVEELERASAARFERLPERGRPLVIVPVVARPARTNSGQNADKNGQEQGSI